MHPKMLVLPELCAAPLADITSFDLGQGDGKRKGMERKQREGPKKMKEDGKGKGRR